MCVMLCIVFLHEVFWYSMPNIIRACGLSMYASRRTALHLLHPIEPGPKGKGGSPVKGYPSILPLCICLSCLLMFPKHYYYRRE